MKRDSPHQWNFGTNIYSVQEARTVGDVAHIWPRIYAVVEKYQVYHHASIIEMEGKLCNQIISIIIDPISNHIYISTELFKNEI